MRLREEQGVVTSRKDAEEHNVEGRTAGDGRGRWQGALVGGVGRESEGGATLEWCRLPNTFIPLKKRRQWI